MVEAMRAAIREGKPFRGVVRNYKKGGIAFWNEVTIRHYSYEVSAACHTS